jgi:uncharacterized membrane protein YphA (DoxX/SURF4 family)
LPALFTCHLGDAADGWPAYCPASDYENTSRNFHSRSRQPRLILCSLDACATTMLSVTGVVLLWIGLIALFIAYLGVAFCGFSISVMRGIRNLIIPFVAFGDAYNSFPFLLWIYGGGVALIALGALLTH